MIARLPSGAFEKRFFDHYSPNCEGGLLNIRFEHPWDQNARCAERQAPTRDTLT